jgi:hypothetical protein
MQDRYIKELKKIHELELEDPRLAHFNVDAVYAAGGGILHGRHVNVSIILC